MGESLASLQAELEDVLGQQSVLREQESTLRARISAHHAALHTTHGPQANAKASRSASAALSLEALPTELLVRILVHLEPEELSCCDQLSRLFHGSRSPVEQALRELANEGELSVPETLPSRHTNWTQALLSLAMVRRTSHQLVAATAFLGVGHSAFVDADGTLLMCGSDTSKYPPLLGRGQESEQAIPAPIAGLEGVRVRSIAVSGAHMLVLSVDGTVFSWGHGRHGVLGHGDEENVAQPKQIEALRDVCALATGFNHTLATTSDGALWVWGSNRGHPGNVLGNSDLGEQQLLPRRLETLADEQICAVTAGWFISYAACVHGGCFSWGVRKESKPSCILGRDGIGSRPLSIPQLCNERLINISLDVFNTKVCAVTAQGVLWRWGAWTDGHVSPAHFAGTLLDSHRVVSVALGCDHILVLTANGAVFSWLNMAQIDRQGRAMDHLGHGDTLNKARKHLLTPRPIKALAGQRISQIFAGRYHSIVAGFTSGAGNAPATSGQVTNAQRAYWSWGSPSARHLILGREENRHPDKSVPHRVMGIGAT